MANKAELIKQASGLLPAGQLARMRKEELEILVNEKGQEKEDVKQVEKAPVNDNVCAGCRHFGNKSQCASCVNYRS